MKVRDIASKYGFDKAAFEVFAEGAKQDGSLHVHGYSFLSIEDEEVEKAVDMFRERLKNMPADETDPDKAAEVEKDRAAKKKVRRIALCVLLIIVVIAAVSMFIMVRNAVFLAVVNETDGPIYGIDLVFSKDGEMDSIASMNMTGGIFKSKPKSVRTSGGPDVYAPIAIGERVPFKLTEKWNKVDPDSERIWISVRVKTTGEMFESNPERDYVDADGFQSLEVPVERGRRTVVILTGNAENGYHLELNGIENMLKKAEVFEFLP